MTRQMKKRGMVVVTGLMLVVGLGLALPAQADESVKMVSVEVEQPSWQERISFGPVGLVLGVGNFTWEHVLSPKATLDVAPSFVYLGFGEDEVYGASLGLGASYFMSGTAPEGLKLSIQASPGYADSSSADSGAFIFGARVMFGYNWIWNNGFTLGLAGGVQYIYLGLEGVDTSMAGVLPALDLNLGFAI